MAFQKKFVSFSHLFPALHLSSGSQVWVAKGPKMGHTKVIQTWVYIFNFSFFRFF